MDNCIFTAHCTEMCCDQSCPILVETSYLLERNGIQFSNPVFSKYSNSILDVVKFLDKYQHQTRRVLENDLGVKLNDAPTVQKADPVQVETIVSMICLPSFEGANKIYILDTTAA